MSRKLLTKIFSIKLFEIHEWQLNGDALIFSPLFAFLFLVLFKK